MASGDDVRSLAIGDYGEFWQIAVVIQQQVELNGTFGLTEASPRKQAETKVDGGGVRAEQLVFKRNCLFLPGLLLRQKSRR